MLSWVEHEKNFLQPRGLDSNPICREILLMTVRRFLARSLTLSHVLTSRYDLNNVERDVKHQIIIIKEYAHNGYEDKFESSLASLAYKFHSGQSLRCSQVRK